jgi:xanthine dehydrogenase YagS FAD-binding subunit
VTEFSLVRPASLDDVEGRPLAGGTDLVPLLREGLVAADAVSDVRTLLPRGVGDGRVGAGTTLADLERTEGLPAALREACRLAASPQLRNMGTIGGNLLQATRCWYWRLGFPCYLHGGDRCHARDGEHREHAVFGNDRCASAHPSDPAAALLALGATVETSRRTLALGGRPTTTGI